MERPEIKTQYSREGNQPGSAGKSTFGGQKSGEMIVLVQKSQKTEKRSRTQISRGWPAAIVHVERRSN
jgi:hypothetical protein